MHKFSFDSIATRTCTSKTPNNAVPKGRAFASVKQAIRAQQSRDGISEEQRMVNEQSINVFRQLMKFNFDNIAGPKASTPEYKFVQLSKKVMYEICPKEFIPLKLLNYFVRAFRMLYLDTLETYPYTETTEKSQFDKIIGALTACAEKGEKIKFIDTKDGKESEHSCPGVSFCGFQLFNNSIQ